MKLVVVGRDGVINERKSSGIARADEWQPVPGSIEALSSLNQAGYRVVVITNQPGISKGYLSIDDLNTIHRHMHNELEKLGAHLDGIFFCPHADSDDCNCRMPRPGLLQEIAERFYCDPQQLTVIGDNPRTVGAADAVGARALLVLTGKGLKARKKLLSRPDIAIYQDLAEAVDALLESPDTCQ